MPKKVWRINLIPGSEEGLDPRRFCIEKNLLGMGWRVPSLPSGADWEEYETLARDLYEKQNREKDWRSSLRTLRELMEKEDLVWTRDKEGIYWLGRVIGEWRYINEEEYAKHDIANVRDCRWEQVGLVDSVPGNVANSFFGQTLRKVSDSTAMAVSKLIYNDLVDEQRYEVDVAQAELFSLLSADECEDLVALYLQLERDYLVVPSTAKRSTVKYEFTLIHRRNHERAVLQVKSGAATLNRDDFAHLPVRRVFLFSAQNRYEGKRDPKIECLDPEEMRSFAEENKALLPARPALWIDRLSQQPS